jgi:hypothetical protein
MSFSKVKFIPVFLFATALLSSEGCGNSGLQVEGKVTFDGADVESGSISFEPADGKGRDFGGLIKDGKFKIVSPPGIEPGAKIVRITAARKTGRKIPAGPPSPPDVMVDEIVSAPKEYNENTKLNANLEIGKINQLEFKLQSSPPQP